MFASVYDALLVMVLAIVAPSPPPLAVLLPPLVLLYTPYCGKGMLPVAAAASTAAAALAFSEVARFGSNDGTAITFALLAIANTGARWPSSATRKSHWE